MTQDLARRLREHAEQAKRVGFDDDADVFARAAAALTAPLPGEIAEIEALPAVLHQYLDADGRPSVHRQIVYVPLEQRDNLITALRAANARVAELEGALGTISKLTDVNADEGPLTAARAVEGK